MARFNKGWIKISRDDWEEDISGNILLWGLWNALLRMAIWKESDIVWNGKKRKLPPGSVIFGIKELAVKWGCSRSVLRKWLCYLHDTQRIVLESCLRGTLATICNWEEIQGQNKDACAPRVHGVRTACARRVHGEPLSKEYKKEEYKKEEYISTGCDQRERPLPAYPIPPSTAKQSDYSPDFELVYNLYPRKEGKRAGHKVFQREIKTPQELGALTQSIERYAKQCRDEHREKRYIKQFSTFMNCWRDYYEELVVKQESKVLKFRNPLDELDEVTHA